MTKKQRAERAVILLERLYPEAVCSLNYNKPYELLFAARLSAQCTDERVNKITPALFKKYPTLEAFANSDPAELEEMVRSCGFYKVKAKNIRDAAAMLIKDFGGALPADIDRLLTLPGVGRKTANLILGDIFGLPAVVADTHCIRISGRLGLTAGKNPHKVELALKKLLPPEKSNDFCHRLVLFGREVCNARKPACETCPLCEICPQVGVKKP